MTSRRAAPRGQPGTVFDTGAMIALERGDRTIVAIIAESRKAQSRITVPAGCVAQSWRDPLRQTRIATFLRLSNVDVVSLDEADARRVGLLLARSRTTDVVDAHVAICAHRRKQSVVTSDPGDIAHLGPSLRVERI